MLEIKYQSHYVFASLRKKTVYCVLDSSLLTIFTTQFNQTELIVNIVKLIVFSHWVVLKIDESSI